MKIAILGYGKMGKTIEALATKRGDEVVLKIGAKNLTDLTAAAIRLADVAIEFSEPTSAFKNIKFCLENQIPIVSGTTAWLDQLDEAKALCSAHQGAFMYASNFSIGVNIFFKLNQQLAMMMRKLSEYEVDMEEIHHTEKKDAPSGTAITLAEDILTILPHKKQWVNEKSKDKEDLSILSKRIPKVPGTHRIRYKTSIDAIEIQHEAFSREGFAAGALMAAKWLVGKEGFFTMDDLMDDLG